MAYLIDLEQVFQKFIQNHKRPQITSVILRNKNKVGDVTLPDIKVYYKARVIKAAQLRHKTSHIDQWNEMESTEINTQLYGQLIFDKGDKNIQWSKDSIFNKWCWGNQVDTCKKK